MPPLVSILIPTYNRLDLLKTALASCLSQAYPYIEVVILDDGSTDGTTAWGEAQTDSRVRYCYRSHRGSVQLAAVTNELVRMAHGSFVTFLDSDDYYLHSHVIEHFVEFQHQTNAAILFGSVEAVDPDGVPLVPADGPLSRRWHGAFHYADLPRAAFVKALLKGNFIAKTSVLIASSAIADMGGFVVFPGFAGDDYPTWLAMSLRYAMEYLPESTTAYRIHPQQISRTRGIDLAEQSMEVARYYFQEAVVKGLLSSSDWMEIERARYHAIARAYWGQIQHLAPGKQWKAVRGLARRQIALGTLPLRMEGMAAYAMSYLHWDFLTPLLAWAARRQLRING